MKKKILNIFIILFMVCLLITGCTSGADSITPENSQTLSDTNNKVTIKEDSVYSATQDVADYIHQFGKLPSNFITKKEAESLGWQSEEGNLWEVADKMSIGGDYFSNREKILPVKSGRKWYECDVNYDGGFRDAERIVFSNDGLIYYTNDHYKTFKKLY